MLCRKYAPSPTYHGKALPLRVCKAIQPVPGAISGAVMSCTPLKSQNAGVWHSLRTFLITLDGLAGDSIYAKILLQGTLAPGVIQKVSYGIDPDTAMWWPDGQFSCTPLKGRDGGIWQRLQALLNYFQSPHWDRLLLSQKLWNHGEQLLCN